MQKIFTTTFTAAILLHSTLLYSTEKVNIDNFIDNAGIKYKTVFTIETSPVQWNRILDNPYLLGRLWELYEFSPRYKVSLREKGVYIVDPTGIEGYLSEIHSGNNERIFFADGRMKNWHVPVSLRGKALFLLKHTFTQNRVTVNLFIYGEGGKNTFTQILLKAISPLLRYYINKRITRNIRDLKIIVKDIDNNPDKIRKMLQSQHKLHYFNRMAE